MTFPFRQAAAALLAALTGFGGLSSVQAQTLSNTATLRTARAA
jgi:hypothetical protein